MPKHKRVKLEYDNGESDEIDIELPTRMEEVEASKLLKRLFPGLTNQIDSAAPPMFGYADDEPQER